MIHFIVHDENDSVGVIVVEGISAGDSLDGWIMDQQKDIAIQAKDDIPIGHKVAITDLSENDTVIKYATDIGRVVAPISAGEHVHVHNVKTKRW
jgi:(2R)-sulfolactate sulfo-lyase subunit alpha